MDDAAPDSREPFELTHRQSQFLQLPQTGIAILFAHMGKIEPPLDTKQLCRPLFRPPIAKTGCARDFVINVCEPISFRYCVERLEILHIRKETPDHVGVA